MAKEVQAYDLKDVKFTEDTKSLTSSNGKELTEVTKKMEDGVEFYTTALIAAGLTVPEVEKVAKFQEQHIKRSVKTAVDVAATVCKENKDADIVKVVMPSGLHKRDTTTTRVIKENTSVIPGTGKTVTRPAVRVVEDTIISGPSKSFIKDMREEFETLLAN